MLTIVIPVYNEEGHLENCLKSIAAQTVMPDEVIVVDNNSSDHSALFASKYAFVKVVKEPKQGIAHARNKGFNTANSDLIGRIDADTILPVDWVENILSLYDGKADFAYTGGGYFYNVSLRGFNSWMLSQIAFRANRFIMGHYILWGSNMVIPKSYWEEVKSQVCTYNNLIHEDLDLAIHLHKNGRRITFKENIKVGVEMKRAFDSDNSKLKANLAMWPNTLQVHGIKSAWLGQLGADFLYYSTLFIMRPVEKIISTFKAGRKQVRSILSTSSEA